MKLTKRQLRTIVLEEIESIKNEGIFDGFSSHTGRLGDDDGSSEKEADKERDRAIASDRKRRDQEDAEADRRNAGRDQRSPEYIAQLRKEKERRDREQRNHDERHKGTIRILNRIEADDLIAGNINRSMQKRLGDHPFNAVDLADRLTINGFDPKTASRLAQRTITAMGNQIEQSGFIDWAEQFDGSFNYDKGRMEFGTQSNNKYYDYLSDLAFKVGKDGGLNRPMLKRLGSFFSGKGFKE
jgi:hypothetical protein